MKSDVEDKHYNYMCCSACLKVANFEEKYLPDTLFHCCEGKEAKGTWRKVRDIIKEKDQEIASCYENLKRVQDDLRVSCQEIAEMKARPLNKDDDWIAAIQEVIDINGEWVHSDELQTLKEQEPTYHTRARQRIKESKETERKEAIK